MAKTKRKKPSGPHPAPRPTPAPPEAPPGAWPEDFPSPRKLAIAAGGLVLFGVLLVRLADANALLWARRLIGVLVGMPDPTWLPYAAGSWGVAMVAFALTTGIVLAFLHPSLGLAAIILLRPWIDSATFPTENAYFNWGVLLMAALWCVRVVMRGEQARGGFLVFALGAYVLFSGVATATGIQLDNSFAALEAWLSHFLVFLLVLNALGKPLSRGILLTAFAFTAGLQGIYAVVSYFYLLPVLRYTVLNDPEALVTFFGATDITPEMAHRVGMNRAFGTMLFPNALAAFFALAVPILASASLHAWRALRAAESDEPAHRPPRRGLGVLLAALGAWALTAILVRALMLHPEEYYARIVGAAPWYLAGFFPMLLSLGAGFVAAAWVAHLIHHHGARRCGMFVRAWLLPLATCFSFWAMLLSFSRGGMLALILGSAVGIVVYLGWLPRFGAKTATAALLVLVLALTALVGGVPATAQDGASAGTTLDTSGINVTTQDLMNPATMMLRVNYWRVALRMFLDNLWAGVGPGNFGVAYPVYQKMEDAPVQLAHTSLQAFCETGVPGGIAFFAFWGYFFLWGLGRVLREADRQRRLELAGIYTGLLAFFVHAGIDISFQHMGLCFFAYLMAGLFVARAKDAPAADAPRGGAKTTLVMLPLLLVIALAFGASARAFSQDVALGRSALVWMDKAIDNYLAQQLGTLNFYWRNCGPKAPKEAPQVVVRNALDLGIPLDELVKEGYVYAPHPNDPTVLRRLGSGVPIPETGVVQVQDRTAALRHAVNAADGWLAGLESVDARFPRRTDLAYTIAQGHGILAQAARDVKTERDPADFLVAYVDWAEECARRSPLSSEMQELEGEAWWLRANLVEEGRIEALDKAIAAMGRAAETAPAYDRAYTRLGQFHALAAKVQAAAGNEKEALRHQDAANESITKGAEIREKRTALGLP